MGQPMHVPRESMELSLLGERTGSTSAPPPNRRPMLRSALRNLA
jgi:hypothetical protein